MPIKAHSYNTNTQTRTFISHSRNHITTKGHSQAWCLKCLFQVQNLPWATFSALTMKCYVACDCRCTGETFTLQPCGRFPHKKLM